LIRPPFEEGLRQAAGLSWRLRHDHDSVAQGVQVEGMLSSTRGESR
jgi:hypothetical protein